MAVLKPLARIGVIADVQFVDQEDGFDYTGVQRRRYRNSLEVRHPIELAR
jgi:hypothetical protein